MLNATNYVPFQGSHQTGMADAMSPDNNDLDLAALNNRLRTLGLYNSSESLLRQQPLFQQPETQQPYPYSQYEPNQSDQPVSATNLGEIHPHDSISMYRQGPRQDGTNVDPGEDQGYESYGTPGQETRRSPPPEDEYFEQMTMGQSQWNGTNVNNMQAMRDRLLHQQADPTLITTLARLEASELQLRDLQATLIAERVARTQIEKQAHERAENLKDYQHELAEAVRALRRARDEGKKNEEERRRLHRAYEEATSTLHEYDTALQVRKARDQGRMEGRDEAWAEAGRWMGQSPPIPVDPIQAVPDTVLRQTPGQANGNLAHDPTPNINGGHGQNQSGGQGAAPSSQQMPQQMPHQMQSMPPPPTQGHFDPPRSYGNQSMSIAQPTQLQQGMHQGMQQGAQQGMQQQPNLSHHQMDFGMPGTQQSRSDPRSDPRAQSHPSVPTVQNTRPGPMPRQTPSGQQSHKTGTQRAQSLSVPARSPAAGTYLDRVEHDAKLQSMLSGSKHPLVTGSSINTSIDKPLPDPRGRSKKTISRRQSLMDDRHDHRNTGHISSGDRYPSFPVNGKGHSRQSSFNSNNRTQDPTNTNTPGTRLGHHRSKLAGALRNGTELDQLSNIDEEQRNDHAHAHQNQLHHYAEQAQSEQRQHPQHRQEPHHHHGRSNTAPQPKARYAPSMPPMRARPRPVMPVPLGRSGSEPQETAGKHTLERPSLAPIDPRESALGLENMHIGQRGPKNPTIMIQPPSSRSNNKSDAQPSYYQPPPPQPPNTYQPTTPHRVPLPAPNQHAPTAYSASDYSPKQSLPNVHTIDYAAQQPLPDSRPTTMFATVITEIDAQGPNGRVHARKQVTRPNDPRQVPLPASRAPTRARASTYAGTVHTIDEVTEEESTREGRKRQ